MYRPEPLFTVTGQKLHIFVVISGPFTRELVAQSEAPLPSYSSSKAIPVQVWTGPEDSRSWSFQISRHIAHEGGNIVRRTHLPPLPRKYSWCSFLLEPGSTPVSQFGRKDYINKKFQWHHRKSNPRLSACSAVLQPTNEPLCIILLYFSMMMILNLETLMKKLQEISRTCWC
jgi:hypothetical protein